MEFPDDILGLIREYSKPLKRRRISDFWLWEDILDFDDMLSYLYEHVYQQFYASYGPFESVQTGKKYVITSTVNKKFSITFNKEDLQCWSGQYSYNGIYYPIKRRWTLEQDIYHKQLLNEKKVVYSKTYLHGKQGPTRVICNCDSNSKYFDYYETCHECRFRL